MIDCFFRFGSTIPIVVLILAVSPLQAIASTDEISTDRSDGNAESAPCLNLDQLSQNLQPPDYLVSSQIVSQAAIDSNPEIPQVDPSPAPEPDTPSESSGQPAERVPDDSRRVFVREIVVDSTVFEQADYAEALRPFEGRELTQEDLEEATDRITELYLNRGYITSRAIAPSLEQVDRNGTVRIQVIEGRLGQIEIQGTQRLNPSYVRSRIRLGASVPLNSTELENQLRLLRADPLFANVEASVRAEAAGVSTLVVRVVEAPPFSASLGADNYSPPSIGAERLGVDLRYRNLTGLGDQIAGSYYRSITGGADVFDFTYIVPLNARNGTLQLRAAPNRNEITQPPFDVFNIRGTQEVYELTYRQPLLRSPLEEFALSIGFSYQNGQTLVFDQPTPFGIGPDENGISRTSVIEFSQDYIRRDPQGAWSLRSQFSFGTGLLNATTNDSPIPDSRFFSWLGQAQRVQLLGDDHLLLIQLDLQLTPDSLLPSQQFIIGGGQSVRGYRQNVRSGDDGVRFSIEDRITIQRNESGAPTIQLAPFVDAAVVWNRSDNPNELPDQTFLIGTGVGLLVERPFGLNGLSLRLDYGLPFIDLDDRGNNAQDNGFYFSIRYQL